ncbi:MAG: hypothetical protein ACXWVD_00560 [Telluria sp.]
MANPWFRLWTDMVNDPKWRTIARVSGQSIGNVIATYVHMMTLASNAAERGRIEGWRDEDIGTALDIEDHQVAAIRAAMQGRVLDGDYLAGWEKRQPVREDGSAERAKAWREQQKAAALAEQQAGAAAAPAAARTRSNAGERARTQDTDKNRVDKELQPRNGAPAPFDARAELIALGVSAQTADDWLAQRKSLRAKVTATVLTEIAKEAAKAGYTLERALATACKRGWRGFEAAWLDEVKARGRAGPAYPSRTEQARAFANALTGHSHEPPDDPQRIIDLN